MSTYVDDSTCPECNALGFGKHFMGVCEECGYVEKPERPDFLAKAKKILAKNPNEKDLSVIFEELFEEGREWERVYQGRMGVTVE